MDSKTKIIILGNGFISKCIQAYLKYNHFYEVAIIGKTDVSKDMDFFFRTDNCGEFLEKYFGIHDYIVRKINGLVLCGNKVYNYPYNKLTVTDYKSSCMLNYKKKVFSNYWNKVLIEDKKSIDSRKVEVFSKNIFQIIMDEEFNFYKDDLEIGNISFYKDKIVINGIFMDYDKLIITIPISIFSDIKNMLCYRTIYRILYKTVFYNINENIDMIYNCNLKDNWNRIVKTGKGIGDKFYLEQSNSLINVSHFEMNFCNNLLSGEYLNFYRTKYIYRSKINNIILNNILRNLEEKNVFMVGCKAEWRRVLNHNILGTLEKRLDAIFKK